MLPSYMGILRNDYQDPYSRTSIMKSRRVFFVAQMEVNIPVPWILGVWGFICLGKFSIRIESSRFFSKYR